MPALAVAHPRKQFVGRRHEAKSPRNRAETNDRLCPRIWNESPLTDATINTSENIAQPRQHPASSDVGPSPGIRDRRRYGHNGNPLSMGGETRSGSWLDEV